MRMQMPLYKPQPWVLWVTLAALVLGAGIASKLNSASDVNLSPEAMRPEQLAIYYSQAKKENDDLHIELKKLRAQYDKAIDAMTGNQKTQVALQKELNDLRVRAGSSAVEGPGIVITIDDSASIKPNIPEGNVSALVTHDTDLLLLVNELRSAGAEAVAINDQRIVTSTAIRCVGPVIQINEHQVGPPFIIRAIGKVDTLYGAMNLPFGVLDQLKPLGIRVEVAKRDKLRVPAATVLPPLEFGKPVVEKDLAQ